MMSILEYAEDVSKSVDQILALCDKLGIKYTDENTDLTEKQLSEMITEFEKQTHKK